MDDRDPLEGMARSIDELFADAERRRGGGPPSHPERGADEPSRDETREAGGARPRRDAGVGSADLIDDVEVIETSRTAPHGPAGTVPIDGEGDEDRAALAEAAAWDARSGTDALDAGLPDPISTTLDAPVEPPPEPQPTASPSGEAALEDDARLDGTLEDEARLAVTAEDEARPGGPLPDDVALRARATAVAVEDFLAVEPRRREAAADAIRDAARAHSEAREVDAPADAAERLALAGRPHTLALAREITSSAVASRLAVRLGMAREEDRRQELFQVVDALSDVVAPAVAHALGSTEDRFARRNFVEALVRLGPAGTHEAERMIADPRWFVVRNGVAILGEIEGEAALGHLTSTLAHADSRVRRETLMALAHIGGENAGILATGMLGDPDGEVRAAAARAVGELRVEKAQRPLQAMLDREEDEDVLVQVLRALGRLRDPGAVPAIEKKAAASFFSRPPTAVRLAAYRALASIGTPHARRLIEAAAEDKEPEVRALAAELAPTS